MNVLENIKKGFFTVFNYPYLSKEVLKDLKGPIVLHMSDTPVYAYNYIFRLLDILKPDFIIHTGDLADNIKLELNHNRIDYYDKSVAKLVEGLEKDSFSTVFYTLGNHDDYDTVNKSTKKGIVLEEEVLSIDKCKFKIGHYHRKDSTDVDFNLFGHSPNPGNYRDEATNNLNGLLNLNIIDSSNKNVFHLNYPRGTNSERGIEFKATGL